MNNFEVNYLMFELMLDLIMIFIMIIPVNFYNFHPMILSILLVFYTIFMVFKMNFFMSSYWYSYITFLVMIGGLMILFMYFTSLVNNSMFFLKMKFLDYFNLKNLLFMILAFILINFNYLFYNNSDLELFLNCLSLKNLELTKNLMMDFIMDMNFYTILYLFFTMICSVLICLKIKVPLRQILNN